VPDPANDGECAICARGKGVKSDGSCTACTETNCASCDGDEPAVCQICNQGYEASKTGKCSERRGLEVEGEAGFAASVASICGLSFALLL